MDENIQKPVDNFAEIGQKLRNAREAKGLTIAEVSANTRINANYLIAIEAGDWESLPAIPFVRGFVGNISTAVGLNAEEMAGAFKQASESEENAAARLEPPTEVNIRPLISIPLPRLAFIGVLVAAVIWVGYLIIQSSTVSDFEPVVGEDPAETEIAELAESEQSDVTPLSPASESADGVGSQFPAATLPAPVEIAPLPVEPPKNLRLRVRGLEKSWIRVSKDRREPVDIYLGPAETAEWEANEEFRLTIGRSQGVSVYLNDEEILLPEESDTLVPEIVLNKLTLFQLEN